MKKTQHRMCHVTGWLNHRAGGVAMWYSTMAATIGGGFWR